MKILKEIIEFNGHVADFTHLVPVFDGQALDRKTLARLCMSLLHDVGYPDDELHRLPPILFHYERLKAHEMRQCLYVVCDVLKDRPFIPWDSDIVYCGTHFQNKSALGYKHCYIVKLVDTISGQHVCSNLCTIDNVTDQVNEYLNYKRPYSLIVVQ